MKRKWPSLRTRTQSENKFDPEFWKRKTNLGNSQKRAKKKTLSLPRIGFQGDVKRLVDRRVEVRGFGVWLYKLVIARSGKPPPRNPTNRPSNCPERCGCHLKTILRPEELSLFICSRLCLALNVICLVSNRGLIVQAKLSLNFFIFYF